MQISRRNDVPYVWSAHYQTVIFELDPNKILAEIETAETSIRKRKSELLQAPQAANKKELLAITKALQVLILLRENQS